MLLLTMTQTSDNFLEFFFLPKLKRKIGVFTEKNYRRWPCVKISALEIYCWRQCVNIVYHANLPPEKMCEYPLYCKFSTVGNALKNHVGKFTSVGNCTFAMFA
jgi:hypothetical protein